MSFVSDTLETLWILDMQISHHLSPIQESFINMRSDVVRVQVQPRTVMPCTWGVGSMLALGRQPSHTGPMAMNCVFLDEVCYVPESPVCILSWHRLETAGYTMEMLPEYNGVAVAQISDSRGRLLIVWSAS